MKLSEYIADLQKTLDACGDLEVVKTGRDGWGLVVAWRAETVRALPVHNQYLKPGHRWRVSSNCVGAQSEEPERLIKIS